MKDALKKKERVFQSRKRAIQQGTQSLQSLDDVEKALDRRAENLRLAFDMKPGDESNTEDAHAVLEERWTRNRSLAFAPKK